VPAPVTVLALWHGSVHKQLLQTSNHHQASANVSNCQQLSVIISNIIHCQHLSDTCQYQHIVSQPSAIRQQIIPSSTPQHHASAEEQLGEMVPDGITGG
jgi:hypothetical protein